MAHTGPAAHADYGYALPIRVDADTSLDFTGSDQPVVYRIFRAGSTVVEFELAVASKRVASGTVPASEMRITPGEYSYSTSAGIGESRILVNHGRLTVVASDVGP